VFGRHSHGKHTLKFYMYSDNPIYFDGMCIISIEVEHDESCSENFQCKVLVEAVCYKQMPIYKQFLLQRKTLFWEYWNVKSIRQQHNL